MTALPNLAFAPPAQALILATPLYTTAHVMVANTAKTITPPTGAQTAKFKSTGDFYAKYRSASQAADSVTNGGFGADTDWTEGVGWTIAAGKGTATGAISTDLSQTPAGTKALIPGQAYLVTFTTTRSAGGVIPKIGGTAGTERTTAATFSEVIIAGVGTDIVFSGNGFTGTVDVVSVVPVAAVPAADNTTGQAPELNPEWRAIGAITDFSIVSGGTPVITIDWFA